MDIKSWYRVTIALRFLKHILLEMMNMIFSL